MSEVRACLFDATGPHGVYRFNVEIRGADVGFSRIWKSPDRWTFERLRSEGRVSIKALFEGLPEVSITNGHTGESIKIDYIAVGECRVVDKIRGGDIEQADLLRAAA